MIFVYRYCPFFCADRGLAPFYAGHSQFCLSFQADSDVVVVIAELSCCNCGYKGSEEDEGELHG